MSLILKPVIVYCLRSPRLVLRMMPRLSLNKQFALLGTCRILPNAGTSKIHCGNHIGRLLRDIQCQRPFSQASPAMSYVQLRCRIAYIHLKVFKLFIILRRHFRSVHGLTIRCRIVMVKIAGVSRMPYLRDDWTFHLSIV